MRSSILTPDENLLVQLIKKVKQPCHLADILKLVEIGFFTQKQLETLFHSLTRKNVIALYGHVRRAMFGLPETENREHRLFPIHGAPLAVLQYFDKSMQPIVKGFTIHEIDAFNARLTSSEHFIFFYQRIEVIDA